MKRYEFIQDLVVRTFSNVSDPVRAHQGASTLILDELLHDRLTKMEAARLDSLALSLMRAKR